MPHKLAVWIRDQLRHSEIKSPTALARKANISSGTMTNLMRHGIVPGPDIVQALARALGADEQVAMELAGYINPVDVPQEWPPSLKALVRRVYSIPEHRRKAWLEQLERWLDAQESLAALEDVRHEQ